MNSAVDRREQAAIADTMKQQQATEAKRSLEALTNLEDESGRASWRRAGVAASALCVLAAGSLLIGPPLFFNGEPRFFTAFVFLIFPMVIGLETASMRQYHRYRAALQAVIQGRMEQQAEAARKAAEAKKEAAAKKADDDAAKARKASERKKHGQGGESAGEIKLGDAKIGEFILAPEAEANTGFVINAEPEGDEGANEERSTSSGSSRRGVREAARRGPAEELKEITIAQLFPNRKVNPGDPGSSGSGS